MHSAEAAQPGWFLTQEELIKRPLHTAYAIDPEGSCEVDDAIEIVADSITADSFVARYHIANGALLHNTPHIEAARKKAWSVYSEAGNEHDLMLDKEAINALSLDGKNHAPHGIPALMIQIEFSAARGATSVELGLSRVQTTCMTHAEFTEGYRQGNPDFILLVNAARRIARRKGLPDPLQENLAELTVLSHMVEGNEGVASKLQSVQQPFLRRVCTVKAYENWPIELDRAVFTKLGIALYDYRPNKHKPLGFKRYTHVTSPLRRFADLANHANIQAYIEGKEPPYSTKDLQQIAAELTAMYIQRSYVFAKTKKQLQKQSTQAA